VKPGGRRWLALGGMDGIGRLLTAAEVAERLGYTERYVWRLGREGVLPRVKVPGRKYVRFAERDVERFVRASREGARVPVVRPARQLPAPRARRF
jgi:excisionase family DNA binding protein